MHPSCSPIKVPRDDPWLAPLGVRCLEFLRSAPAQRRDCLLSWREQTNQVTSYLDASPIYSSSELNAERIRVFSNGLLLFGRGPPREDVCLRGGLSAECIRPGDTRNAEQPGLLSMHHTWVLEHNHIAIELSELNLHWSDEKIYQETRRIVGAMVQHITYREFLPLVLGREVCKLFNLELEPTGYFNGYDVRANPTVSNAFAAAAFRFGHSLIQHTYLRSTRNHQFIDNSRCCIFCPRFVFNYTQIYLQTLHSTKKMPKETLAAPGHCSVCCVALQYNVRRNAMNSLLRN